MRTIKTFVLNLILTGALTMSVFQTASVKVRDLLGLTARGQTTMANSLPVTIASNQSALPITDNSGSLTVDGTVAVSAVGGTVAISGALTDTQLRATPVPVSGALTDTQLRATPVPVSGALTDAELRASAVPVEITGKSINNVWWEARRGYSGGLEPSLGDLFESDAGSGVGSSVTSPSFLRAATLAKGSLETAATIAKINEYFSGNNAAFDGTAIWVRIPLSHTWTYSRASVVAVNALTSGGSPITLEVKVYGMATDGEVFTTTGSFVLAASTIYAEELATLADGGRYTLGGDGGAFPFLLLKVTPSTDPDGGYWSLIVSVSE